MRNLAAALGLCVFTANSLATNLDSGAIEKAQVAAQTWLSIVDSGHYERSWEKAAEPIRIAVSKADWERKILSARTPFGLIKSRTLISATYTERLAGTRVGKYVVIQYSSKFSGDKTAIETITPMMELDGAWRIAGYYIK